MAVIAQSLSGGATLALLAPLMAWSIYGRYKRNVGRQPLKPRRLIIRIVILLTILCGFLAYSNIDAPLLAATLAGLVLGAGIAQGGLRLTRFESTPAGDFYTPNTALGLAVSALFMLRIGYRMVVMATAAGGPATAFNAASRTPLTMGLLALVIGYYLAFYVGVLRRPRGPWNKDLVSF